MDCALVGLQSSHLNNSWEAYLPVDIVFNDGVRLQVKTISLDICSKQFDKKD